MKHLSLLLFITAFAPGLWADINSTNSEMKFKLNSSSNPSVKMVLGTEGLNVGNEDSASANLSVAGNAIVTERVSIGQRQLASTNLYLAGSYGTKPLIATNSIQLNDHYLYLLDTSSDNVTLSLPSASESTGRIIEIKKTSTLNSLYLHASELIDDTYSDVHFSGNELGHIRLTSDGSKWLSLGMSGTDDTLTTDNLIAWWSMEETSGTTLNDRSSNDNNGTLNGGMNFSDNISSRSNWQGLHFDGSDDYVSVAGDASLDTPTGLSVAAWIYDEDGVINHSINKDGGTRIWIIRNNSTTAVNWHVWNSAGALTQFRPANSWVIGSWFHLVCTAKVNAGNIEVEVFFNGESVGTSSFAGTQIQTNTAQDILLGSNSTGSNRRKQRLDDVRIYNKALNAGEVEVIYNSTR